MNLWIKKQIMTGGLLAACLSLFWPSGVFGAQAEGHDSRIDLLWEAARSEDVIGYNIYRAESPDGPYDKLNADPHPVAVYSDFIGENGRTFHYRISRVSSSGRDSVFARNLSAETRKMSEEELLTSIQKATFRYFWDYAHPESGLTRERYYGKKDGCAVGGTGFGLLAVIVGIERDFISREAGADRVLKMVRFLEKADRFHGAWPHWLNGSTGKTIRFSQKDDGADLVETALLMQGLLTVRQYFDGSTFVEKTIHKRITRLWEDVEWDWFLKNDGSKTLYWHWSPNYGFEKGHMVRGYNECMITYLLAIASPTHPIPASAYSKGWAGGVRYKNGTRYFGIKQPVGPPMGGPLFLSHYSFICFDPRFKKDRYCNYFENARAVSLIHQAYSIRNPNNFDGYSKTVWGLTACYTPDGYRACHPGPADNGTVAPTAALGSMPYTPEESLAALKHYYYQLGDRLWGPFGFYDAFNLDRDWFSDGYIAIDQGPILCMIENHRTGLLWEHFMENPEIQPMLDAIGWKRDK